MSRRIKQRDMSHLYHVLFIPHCRSSLRILPAIINLSSAALCERCFQPVPGVGAGVLRRRLRECRGSL